MIVASAHLSTLYNIYAKREEKNMVTTLCMLVWYKQWTHPGEGLLFQVKDFQGRSSVSPTRTAS